MHEVLLPMPKTRSGEMMLSQSHHRVPFRLASAHPEAGSTRPAERGCRGGRQGSSGGAGRRRCRGYHAMKLTEVDAMGI